MPNCRKSNFGLRTAVFPSIPLSFQQRTCFVKCKGRLDHFWGLLFVIIFVFATPPRFQLANELFHQSSFYLHFNIEVSWSQKVWESERNYFRIKSQNTGAQNLSKAL